MKYLLTILMALGSINSAFAEGSVPLPAGVKALGDSGRPGAIQKIRLGTQLIDYKVQVLKAVYDFSVLGGASGSTYVLKDSGGGSATLPAGALIQRVLFDVINAPVGAGSSIAVGTESTPANFKAATAVGTWTGRLDGVPVGSAATAVKLSSEATVKAKITGAALTSGKINAFVEYLVSE